MKLSLMKNVFKTVNSENDCELAKELLKDWDHDENSVKIWRASANFICFFTNHNKKYIIRFNSEDERNIRDIEEEIKLLNYLLSKSIRTANPILSRNDKYVERKETIYGTFYSVVFQYISGDQYEIEDLDLDSFYQWGKCLGHLHNTTKELPGETQIKRKSQKQLFKEIIEKYPPENGIENEEINKINIWLNSLSRDQESYGLIHYDFELDNLIWNERELSIIDFDDSVYSWFIADIAYALRDIFDEGYNIDLSDKRYIKFINGYREKTNLSQKQIEQIPDFYKLHNFISYKKLEHSIDLDLSDNNPKWMNELIKKLSKYKSRYFQKFKNSNI